MTYYFNSQEQIAGDDAYNKHDFQDALVHYKKAYAILNKIAAQRGFQSSKGFKDALAYVLTEIILTTSDVMQDIIHEGFDYKELKKLWREIHESVNELDVVYAELKHYVPRNTTIEHYRRVYTTLADVGEAVSDNIVDLLDEDTPDNDPSKDAYLKSAINWLLKANKYRAKSGENIALSAHIGYLNLLERRYKINPNAEFLTRIHDYIQNKDLLNLELVTMERLEVLSYQLLVAVKNQTANAAELGQQCKQLISDADDVDLESLVIQDIQKLIDSLPPIVAPTQILTRHKRKRHTIILDDSDEESEKAVPVDEELLEQSHLEPASTDVQLSKRYRQENSAVLVVEAPTGESSVVVSQEPKKIRSSITFFAAPLVASVPAVVQPSHSKAFIETFNWLAQKYQNTGFLANVFSLIGDFYYDKPSLPFKNLPIIPYELYETVLLLNNTHRVAIAKMSKIYNADEGAKRMIDDRNRFSMTNTRSTSQKTAVDIFGQAIHGHVDEIETFLAHDLNGVNGVLDNILHYIVKEIKNEQLAGSRSHQIAEQISVKYKQLLQTQLPSNQDEDGNRSFVHPV